MKPLITTKKVTKSIEVEEKQVGTLKAGDWIKFEAHGDTQGPYLLSLSYSGITLANVAGTHWGPTHTNADALTKSLSEGNVSDIQILEPAEVIHMLSKQWGLDKVPESNVRVFSGTNLHGDFYYWKISEGEVFIVGSGVGNYWRGCARSPHEFDDGSHRINDLTELFGPHKENVLRKHTKP